MTDEQLGDPRREAPDDEERYRRLIDAAAESALEESDEGILAELKKPLRPEVRESVRQVEFDMARIDPTEAGERRRQEYFRKMELIGEELYDIPPTPEERKRRLDEIVVRVPNLRRYIAGSLEEYQSFSDEEMTRQLRRWAPLGDLTAFNKEIVEWSDGRVTGGDDEGPPLCAGARREGAPVESAYEEKHADVVTRMIKPPSPEVKEAVRQVEFGMTRIDDTEDGKRRRQEFFRKMERIGEELYDIPQTPEERKARLDEIVLRVPNLRQYITGSLEEYKSFSDQDIVRQLRRWAPLGDLIDFNREIVEWADGRRTGGSDEEGPPLRAGMLRASAAGDDDGGESDGEKRV